VKPDPNYIRLLTNHKGYTNTDTAGSDAPVIECEIQPPSQIYRHAYSILSKHPYNLPDNEFNVYSWYLSSIKDRKVMVIGTFVADCAHNYKGERCGLLGHLGGTGCCDEGKTEIHPVTCIVAFPPRPDGGDPYRLQKKADNSFTIYAFSESSSSRDATDERWWHQPSHSYENRTIDLSVPLFPVGPGEKVWCKPAADDRDVNWTESANFNIVNDRGMWKLSGKIVTGTATDSKGFYFGKIRILYYARQLSFLPPSFPSVTSGAAVERVLGLENSGTEPIGVSISAPARGSQFSWVPFTRETLAPGEKRQIPITLRATKAGTATDLVVVTYDAPGSPHQIPLACPVFKANPQCLQLLQTVAGLESQISQLEEQYHFVSYRQLVASDLIKKIGMLKILLSEKLKEATESGCVP
jgi:hypothetical protein